MRKIVLTGIIALLTLITFNANAQYLIEAGYTNSKYVAKFGNETEKSDPLAGFNIGISREFHLIKGAYLESGLGYMYLTNKDEYIHNNLPLLDMTIKSRQNDHYIYLPVQLKYLYSFSENFSIFAFGGPKFVVGLSSANKVKLKGSVLGVDFSGDLKYDFYKGEISSSNIPSQALDAVNDYDTDEQKYKRFDIQMGLGIGVEIAEFYVVKFGYDWGLLNKYSGVFSDDITLKRNQFYFNIGYRF